MKELLGQHEQEKTIHAISGSSEGKPQPVGRRNSIERICGASPGRALLDMKDRSFAFMRGNDMRHVQHSNRSQHFYGVAT